MIPKNPVREIEIYKLWTGQNDENKRYSAKRIAELTGIPINTVYYYIRAFKNGRIPDEHSIVDLYIPP
jgi:hypothetical protein